MNRRDLVLAVLTAAEGHAYQPVQIQKALFLISRNVPELVTEGPNFGFAPYDYGPFDSQVYGEAEALSADGLATVSQASNGRWKTYAASSDGIQEGKKLLACMQPEDRDYVERVSKWVRSMSFGQLVKSIYEAYPEMKEKSIFVGA